jgi:ABC-type Zn uptake system ZnuABC Zn-binding protein ZnuA
LFYYQNLKKMKKLVLFFAVVAAVSFASCGNKAAKDAATKADSAVVVDTVAVVDSAAADTAAVK